MYFDVSTFDDVDDDEEDEKEDEDEDLRRMMMMCHGKAVVTSVVFSSFFGSEPSSCTDLTSFPVADSRR